MGSEMCIRDRVKVLLGAIGEPDEIGHRLGGLVFEEIEGDVTVVGVQSRSGSHRAPFVEDESFLFTLPIDVGSREFSAKHYRWLERGIPWIVLDHELDPY